MIQSGSGNFEYYINNDVVFSGRICFSHDKEPKSEKTIGIDRTSEDYEGYVHNGEIYKMLKYRGYNLGDNFKNIISYEVCSKNIQGYVKWNNDWIYFLDGLFKFTLLENLGAQHLSSPVSVRKIILNPKMMENISQKSIVKFLFVT